MANPFEINRLGKATHPSPLRLSYEDGDWVANFVRDEERVLHQIEYSGEPASILERTAGAFEKAGPRDRLFFEPQNVHAAIVTCGGLCPGLNDVIRAIVLALWDHYGVRRITGFRHGYRGLLADTPYVPIPLNPKAVGDIHRHGGTILGSARGGGERTGEIVDTLIRHDVNMLFTIGGDGTQRGALRITEEIERRRLPIAVVGVPKTIDNDLSFVERSFGFETAVSEAVRAVDGAHREAVDAINGIGLVKLMGRESGFIAAHAALASNEADFVLIPEVPFTLEGENGLFAHLEERLQRQGHAMIVVAEGAGRQYVRADGHDAGGNARLGDIGVYLRDAIENHFQENQQEIGLKYIDPSYTIRSQAANPADSIYCARLGSNAVHAAMSGRTACIVGIVNNRLVHVPIFAASDRRNCVSPDSPLWLDVLVATGQPTVMRGKHDSTVPPPSVRS
ncbi:MAG: ATP-dependent 6-phosphofructokinase [Polyangiaceae bacterium]|nr:ATP-dependent 6-phosphofructokinase [Polyangiaceae bacterium]